MLSYQTDIFSYQINMFVISILISFVFTLLHLISKSILKTHKIAVNIYFLYISDQL